MSKTIRVLHTEWSDGWGRQEIRIINEMIAVLESYAKKSRKYVSENFSINKITEKILKTYIDLTEK